MGLGDGTKVGVADGFRVGVRVGENVGSVVVETPASTNASQISLKLTVIKSMRCKEYSMRLDSYEEM